MNIYYVIYNNLDFFSFDNQILLPIFKIIYFNCPSSVFTFGHLYLEFLLFFHIDGTFWIKIKKLNANLHNLFKLF